MVEHTLIFNGINMFQTVLYMYLIYQNFSDKYNRKRKFLYMPINSLMLQRKLLVLYCVSRKVSGMCKNIYILKYKAMKVIYFCELLKTILYFRDFVTFGFLYSIIILFFGYNINYFNYILLITFASFLVSCYS